MAHENVVKDIDPQRLDGGDCNVQADVPQFAAPGSEFVNKFKLNIYGVLGSKENCRSCNHEELSVDTLVR